MKTPKVSIIIPNYNTDKYFLKECIDSALNSEGIPFEVIIVNDGSTDDSYSYILDRYLKYSNVKIINQVNKGLSAARNTGIKHAIGKYIAILDSDDYIYPNKLKEQAWVLDNFSDFDVVYSKACFFSKSPYSGLSTIDYLPAPNGIILAQILKGNFIHTDTFFARKSALNSIDLYNENLRELEDWDLYIRLGINKNKFYYIDKVLSLHRIHNNSMITNQKKMNDTMINVLRNHENTLSKLHLTKEHCIAIHTLYNIKLNNNDVDDFYVDLYNDYKTVGLSFTLPFIKLSIKKLFSIRNKQIKLMQEINRIWSKNEN